MAILDNLLAYYSLADATDAHSTNDLTNNNATTFATGLVGNAADFEASSSQSLSIADNAALGTLTDLSISLWINLESTTGFPVPVSKDGVSAGTRSYGIYFAAGVPRFYVSGNGTAVTDLASTAGAISTGVWNHIVVKHDATAQKIYITVNDQATPDEAAHTTGVFDSAAAFRIGSTDQPGSYFDGLVDEVGIWGRVLTEAEITYLNNAGAGRAYADFASTKGGFRYPLGLGALTRAGGYAAAGGGSLLPRMMQEGLFCNYGGRAA